MAFVFLPNGSRTRLETARRGSDWLFLRRLNRFQCKIAFAESPVWLKTVTQRDRWTVITARSAACSDGCASVKQTGFTSGGDFGRSGGRREKSHDDQIALARNWHRGGGNSGHAIPLTVCAYSNNISWKTPSDAAFRKRSS